MERTIIGIDVAKKKFDVALLLGEKTLSGAFKNTAEGFAMFLRWLERHEVERVHACMEATGTYGEDLATYLHSAGHVVSVVNPAKIKGFAQSELSRTKTDKADAALIARFCRAMQPEPWQPPTPEVKELQSLVRRLESLNDMLNQERNRLAITRGIARESIERTIKHIETEIATTKRLIREHLDRDPALRNRRDLLESIPGIGPATSAMVLAEFGDVTRFQDARHMASFCGLTPRNCSSGERVADAGLIRAGNPALKALLMEAGHRLMRLDPYWREIAESLRARGKHVCVIVAAVANRWIRRLHHDMVQADEEAVMI